MVTTTACLYSLGLFFGFSTMPGIGPSNGNIDLNGFLIGKSKKSAFLVSCLVNSDFIQLNICILHKADILPAHNEITLSIFKVFRKL